MRRLLAILAAVALVALATGWLAGRQGGLVYELDGWRIAMPAGLAIGLLALFAVLAVIAVRLLGVVFSAPGAIGDWWRLRRQRRGEDALSKGLVAAAAGDVAEVRRYAKSAHAALGRSPLGLLLAAQAAALDGDGDGQRAAYRAMLEHKQTEFLGLRGLYLDAMARDDDETAVDLASRAHALRPRAPWAANALFDLKSARGEWADAKAVLENLTKAKILPADVATRRRAVLLTAEALDVDGRDPARAGELALAALDLAPGLTPAAVIAVRRLTAEGKTWRAQDVIETAWAQAPHPDLAAAYAAIRPDESQPETSERLIALAHLKRDHFESRMLEAEQHMAMNRWSEARRVLAPLARGFASARICTLMAEIEQTQRRDAAAAHTWLERAVRAPRDAEWRCTVCGWSSPRWQAVCGHCHAFDSLSWTAPESLKAQALPPGDNEDDAYLVEAGALPHALPPARAAKPATVKPAAEGEGSSFVVMPRAPDDPGPGGERYDQTDSSTKGAEG